MPTRDSKDITETKSRRIVTSLLPADRFVERDLTERDYGVDLIIECFDDQEPSGAYLHAQLKGSDIAGPPPGDSVSCDLKVAFLKRAERHSTPFILFWCPVDAPDPCCYFLWLQEYIRVVLNRESSDWRNHTQARVHIPIGNRLPDNHNYDRLRHVADHPARTAEMGQLSRIAHDASHHADDLTRVRDLFAEAVGLDAIFGNEQWEWSRDHRRIVESGLRACEIAIEGRAPADAELDELGWQLGPSSSDGEVAPARPQLDEERRSALRDQTIARCTDLLRSTVAIYFDDAVAYAHWSTLAEHDF